MLGAPISSAFEGNSSHPLQASARGRHRGLFTGLARQNFLHLCALSSNPPALAWWADHPCRWSLRRCQGLRDLGLTRDSLRLNKNKFTPSTHDRTTGESDSFISILFTSPSKTTASHVANNSELRRYPARDRGCLPVPTDSRVR
jgi:hypothetical protein